MQNVDGFLTRLSGLLERAAPDVRGTFEGLAGLRAA